MFVDFLLGKIPKGKHKSMFPVAHTLEGIRCRAVVCPVRLSYATVDSYIGKLRAIFKDAGREGD